MEKLESWKLILPPPNAGGWWGGRGRHPETTRKKGTRGNHFDVSTGDFKVPVETVQTKWEKSDVETRVYRHPWKPTYPRRAPVETGHPWKPRVGAPVETGKWFPRVPDFTKGAPVETDSTIPAEKSDVETSPLVPTGARRRFSFPRVPNRAPVETNTPGQTWKRAPVETVSPGRTWKPLRIGHPWEPFRHRIIKGCPQRMRLSHATIPLFAYCTGLRHNPET